MSQAEFIFMDKTKMHIFNNMRSCYYYQKISIHYLNATC